MSCLRHCRSHKLLLTGDELLRVGQEYYDNNTICVIHVFETYQLENMKYKNSMNIFWRNSIRIILSLSLILAGPSWKGRPSKTYKYFMGTEQSLEKCTPSANSKERKKLSRAQKL